MSCSCSSALDTRYTYLQARLLCASKGDTGTGRVSALTGHTAWWGGGGGRSAKSLPRFLNVLTHYGKCCLERTGVREREK